MNRGVQYVHCMMGQQCHPLPLSMLALLGLEYKITGDGEITIVDKTVKNSKIWLVCEASQPLCKAITLTFQNE